MRKDLILVMQAGTRLRYARDTALPPVRRYDTDDVVNRSFAKSIDARQNLGGFAVMMRCHDVKFEHHQT